MASHSHSMESVVVAILRGESVNYVVTTCNWRCDDDKSEVFGIWLLMNVTWNESEGMPKFLGCEPGSS